MKKLTVLVLLLLNFARAFAQQSVTVEMDNALRSSGKIYVVVVTIVIIFAGLAFYLFSIDRRLKKIEKEK
ncbi:CcmD family protein [Mucilaginibacter sp. SG564]|uniref:CcmD family protein n=1 Tax=unclassified Mucilaginibacter TaxID=2617802 RepID=UPI001551B0C3|nr:CcmD family protein [Mucilaginibacter sp. SG564]NOW97305.1 CcmD family protein [Mucilaginibacter sp. SG564]